MRIVRTLILCISLVLTVPLTQVMTNTATIVYASTDTVVSTDTALRDLLKKYASKRDITEWEAIVVGINNEKIKTPLFATPFFKRLDQDITEKKGEYRLVTDYARIVIAYKSHGKDPSKAAGYDLIQKITGFEHMQKQGLNAYTWALIALYGQPDTVIQPLITNIIAYQLPSGGFGSVVVSSSNQDAISKEDVDLTAMCITALAPYTANESARAAVEKAIAYLSGVQTANGAYLAHGAANTESTAQVIIALCAAGVELTDTRFIKNGYTLTDALQAFYLPDGTYAHTAGGQSDTIATRQAALALSALKQAAHYNKLSNEDRISAGIRRGIFEIDGGVR